MILGGKGGYLLKHKSRYDLSMRLIHCDKVDLRHDI